MNPSIPHPADCRKAVVLTTFAVTLLLCSWPTAAIGQATPATSPLSTETALTNSDVVKLCKLDLGDAVVIAKINQTKAVDFKLDTDDLAKLKEQGVSKDVIAAMLRRTTSPAQQLLAMPLASPGPQAAYNQDNVRLGTQSGDVALKMRVGRRSSTDIVVNTLHYFVYPESMADVRTRERRPTLLVRLDDTPKASLAFVVRPEPNKKEDERRVKVGKAGMLKSGSWFIPDGDWTVPYDAAQESPGLWRFTLKEDLKPGEYGLFCKGELYAFGVDD
jgi:hypothetical protein